MQGLATVGRFWVLAALAIGVTSCNRNPATDPAEANMAPTDPGGQVAQNAAPVLNSDYEEQLNQAPEPPPPLPEYSQPECPGDNYLWTPGYWAYSPAGYYWAPGDWVMAPWAGALWTPPWWGYSGRSYLWHAGYWGPYVGFYGGINYGFGYTGQGFYGGYWQNGSFNYNRAAMNVNARVRNVYDRHVIDYTPRNRISYNGGRDGLSVRPTPSEQVALRERRMQALPVQRQQERDASANRGQFASVNQGHPAVAAARPLARTDERSAREAATPAENARPTPNERPRAEAPPTVNARPEKRPRMENARPATEPLNIRSTPAEHPRLEQAPRAPEIRQEARPVPPARPTEARPAPEAKPPAPQKKAPEVRPTPPRDDREKHQK